MIALVNISKLRKLKYRPHIIIEGDPPGSSVSNNLLGRNITLGETVISVGRPSVFLYPFEEIKLKGIIHRHNN